MRVMAETGPAPRRCARSQINLFYFMHQAFILFAPMLKFTRPRRARGREAVACGMCQLRYPRFPRPNDDD